jgi:hypothetical protein
MDVDAALIYLPELLNPISYEEAMSITEVF